MKIKKFNVYSADLNPKYGTEPGKVRPVVVVQTDMLNEALRSTVICPITTNVVPKASLLRVHLKKNEAGLNENSDIIIDSFFIICTESSKEKGKTISSCNS